MDTATAHENFGRWKSALLTGDPAKVALLYAKNLTLLPTMQTKTIRDHAGALNYFTFFGSFHPTVEILEEIITLISDDTYLHCGVYRFTIDTKNGRGPLDARFSFVWKKNEAVWEILHHHSSRVLAVSADGQLKDGRFGA